ncbi:MAG: DUF896 domain-containing protein [bacterium]
MLGSDKMQRINELARKSRKDSLTETEKEEQKRLRGEYLAAFRANFRSLLDSIEFVDPEIKH